MTSQYLYLSCVWHSNAIVGTGDHLKYLSLYTLHHNLEECTCVRIKITHFLPYSTIFVVIRGQRFSLVTVSFVKIVAKSTHSWPHKPLSMVTRALFSISLALNIYCSIPSTPLGKKPLTTHAWYKDETTVPVVVWHFKYQTPVQERVDNRYTHVKDKYTRQLNKTHHVKERERICLHDIMRMHSDNEMPWYNDSTIVKPCDARRSYIVEIMGHTAATENTS